MRRGRASRTSITTTPAASNSSSSSSSHPSSTSTSPSAAVPTIPTGETDATHQLLASPKTNVKPRKEFAVQDLLAACHDITALSITLQNIAITEDVAGAFCALVRGDNRSWEAIAVDILRQKARWNSVIIEECTDDYVDRCLTLLLAIDNCHTLHVSSVQLTSFAAYAMTSLGFNKHLKRLELDLLDLSHAIPALAKGLKRNKSLEVLVASRCGLNDDNLAELIGSLVGHPEIQELKIFGNKCRTKGLAAVTDLLQGDKTKIRFLDLSYQHVKPDDEFDISWLCAALTSNTSLKILDLDNDSLDDGHLAHLTAALGENKTLEDLRLNHNLITGDGVALLASQFAQMKGLKKISMYSNKFEA